MKSNKFSNEKTLIEANENIQILSIEKGPLKKQLVDNLYIEPNYKIIAENKIQNIDKFNIDKTPRADNIIVIGENLEILPNEKKPLKKQSIDALFIEGLILNKFGNLIQNVDKFTIMKIPRAKNIIEIKDNIEIFPIEKEPLKKQLVDDLYIESIKSLILKPENIIQNTENLLILKTSRPQNTIEAQDNLEILPKQKEPLKKQLIDALLIEGLLLIKPDNKIQNIEKLSIFKT